MFLLLNIAYTGHGFAWLWPEQVRLQLWIIPFLMALFGMSGLLFASSFLDTRNNFPVMHRAMIRICAAFGSLLLALFLLDYNTIHMAVAFVFVIVFSVLMLLLGVQAVRSGYTPAWYFLFAAISSMTGAALTDLSVAGVIPYNAFTYRAVEIGGPKFSGFYQHPLNAGCLRPPNITHDIIANHYCICGACIDDI